ncbi:OmpA/MotB domain protein [Geobacter metallireducens RCH3]|uniref:Peptidoglycan-binding inner membrane lipoprotein YiaD, OmpA family n=1 Tax=Geobacter metallireducens (strain ATCC 53774 / DSM 7210 / GS-15) TaxID=269799 RepID=Q39YC2_GEOMG|nr:MULTISPECIES: OmpA family protein [Geobacter]ABB30752.1 peptidoglycan-binding inner membrane lipoprotein YiaD, OmpA family [Geobacter metallireducens GS-15]EHP88163.1 OmpA/MotB domain protein [Geobacter metallireducens RCH3]MBT1075321.1 OmpA family protein [Geobacter grbiciae]
MKRTALCALTIAMAALTGCAQPMTRTQTGAALGTGVGAAVGAGLGQAIGRNTESTLIGAAAGALAGGLTGGAIGNYMDKQEQAMRQAVANVEGASIQRDQNVLAVTFKSDILFPINSAVLQPGANDEITRVAQVLTQYPATTITIAGHTDSTGSDALNQTLSERRATAVKNALAARGVAPARMNAIGFGKSKPIADNSTEAGRSMNRRVEITIVPQQQ